MIAKWTLGDEMRADALIKANIRHRHINVFPANIRLVIPDIPARPAGGLPPWKRNGGATV
jgi:hypothetical protein